jgi:glyoxylase-like metal-dependent hydrolase (beta-lactamase superfamily II)
VAVIDPGPADEAHLAAIAQATRGERVSHILITHSHRDHCDGARALQRKTGGEIAAFGPTGTPRGAGAPGLGDGFVDAAFVPDRKLADGDTIRGRHFALDVLHMPGHAPDHLCFALVGKRTMFTGDHVMGWNTTAIAPPEGDLAQFMTSLERLMQRHDKMFLPGHGGRIQTPQRVVKAYIMHRKWREQTILACLDEGVGTIPRIVERLYGTLDAGLKEAAALSVLAHLQHLINRDLVAAEGPGDWLSAFYLRPSS